MTDAAHVLLGFVPSPEGEAALHAATAEASRRGLSLLVVNASRGGATVDPAIADEKTVASVLDAANQAGVKVQVLQPSGADPVDELLKLAEDPQAALLVIGLRRRSPVGKLIMGSSSQRLLLQASCPVLAVKVR